MTTVIFLAIEENFRKGKEEVESQTGFGIFEQIFTLSLHNAYYTVFSPFLTENLNSAKLM